MADDSLLPGSLQDYFDDLLQDARKLESTKESPVRPKRIVRSVPESRPTQDVAIRPVEKARLEKLLTSTHVQPAPAAVSSPKVETEVQTPTAIQKTEPDVLRAKPHEEVPPATVEAKLDVPLASAVDVEVVEPESDEVEDVFVGTEHSLEALRWLPNGRPSWGQERFDVLLFDVSGLTLAVPLIALGQIQPITDELTPLFGQAEWFMGLLPTPVGKLRTVNTALFVMPERYDENFLDTAKYVVSINGLPWGLAVNSVNQPISLDPGEVKWRLERSKRPWLAGTVKEYMCALIDIPMMGRMLMETDANLTRNSPI